MDDLFAPPSVEEMIERKLNRCKGHINHDWHVTGHTKMRTDGSYLWDVIEIKTCNFCGTVEKYIV